MQSLGSFQNLFRSRAHPVILCEHSPTHDAACVNEKLSRSRYVSTIFALTFVHQIVPSDRLEFRIRQKREGVAGALTQRTRLFWSVNTDRDWTNSYGGELR